MIVPSEPPEGVVDAGTSGAAEAVQRWRLVVSRAALPADFVARDLHAAWGAALSASGLPLAGLDAQRPKPRFAIAAPLASGIQGEGELVDIWLVERLPSWRVREALSSALPAAHALVDVYDVWLGEPAVAGRVAASVYRAALAAPADAMRVARAADALLASDALPRDRRRGDRSVRYDLRPFLVAFEVSSESDGGVVLRMTLAHDPARGVGRPEEALAALGDALDGSPLAPVALVRERLILTEPQSSAPPANAPYRTGGAARAMEAPKDRLRS